METLNEINPKASWRIYNKRFKDLDDFTFVFVGKFDIDSIRPLVLQYLGNLYGAPRVENWRDTGIHPPEGVIKKTVYRGKEPGKLEFHRSASMESNRQLRHLIPGKCNEDET